MLTHYVHFVEQEKKIVLDVWLTKTMSFFDLTNTVSKPNCLVHIKDKDNKDIIGKKCNLSSILLRQSLTVADVYCTSFQPSMVPKDQTS